MADGYTELFLTEHMPLAFNSLVIEYTSRCTARCAMCYQSAGPQGSPHFGRSELAEETIRRIIDEATVIPTLEPRFHITGGEAFLREAKLLRLVRYARDRGFSVLTTTTNGFWAARPERADETCRRAWQAGLTGMEISWDAWHMPYVRGEAVSNCLDSCAKYGIEANLRILSSRSNSYDDALARLRPGSLERAETITCAPIHATGRAQTEIAPSDVPANGTLNETCHTILNLTVNPRGHVAPCCAGIDQLDQPLFGSIHDYHLQHIVAKMDRSVILRALVFRGVSYLRSLIQEAGVDPGADFKSICAMCWTLFSTPEYVAAMQAALDMRRRKALTSAIALLKDEVPA